MADAEYEVGAVHISLVSTEHDTEVRVDWDDELALVQILGMIELAKDTIIRQMESGGDGND